MGDNSRNGRDFEALARRRVRRAKMVRRERTTRRADRQELLEDAEYVSDGNEDYGYYTLSARVAQML